MRPLILTALCVLVLITPAQAQDPLVDPGSPAGTEYQLPIERARQEAGGRSTRSPAGSAAEAPLFGAGVERKAAGSATEINSDQKAASPSGGATPKVTAGEQRRRADSSRETVRAQAAAPDDSDGGLLAIGGGALAVLLIGGVAGLALRGRNTS